MPAPSCFLAADEQEAGMRRREVLATGILAGTLGPVAAAAPAGRARAEPWSGNVAARDGTGLFIREWGKGRPMLFVHAWALESRMWQLQFMGMAAHGFRCVGFDRRGHGRSDAPAKGYDLDTLADDIASVIQRLDLRDITLVGHSMGGGEVVRYLARHGGARVRNVVLVAPTTPFLTKTADNPYGAPTEFFKARQAEWIADFPAWIEANKKPFFTPDTSPETMDWVARMMTDAYLPALIACNEAFTGTDLRPDLKKIDRPTLVIQGDKDVSAPLEITGRRTAAGIAGAKLKVYEGAPHGLFVTHASRLNADILAHATA
jgi:non-heme chloroperoxidase